MDGSLELELRKRIEDTGFDLVEFTRAGSRTRPILRLRIDRLEAGPHSAVTVGDCAMVSRTLEPFLDAFEGLGQRYLLEVSSPGVERPLVRSRDFERFSGQEVALHGEQPLAGTSRRLQGELLGLVEREGQELVRVRIAPGEVVEVPRDALTRAHLVFRWAPQD